MTDIESLRLLWAEANAAKVADGILSQIKELASAKSSASGESSGSQGSVHSGTPKKASK
jgi:hypothetical protein